MVLFPQDFLDGTTHLHTSTPSNMYGWDIANLLQSGKCGKWMCSNLEAIERSQWEKAIDELSILS